MSKVVSTPGRGYRPRMAFPRRLLIPGEDLVLELRPHWAALTLPALVVLAATVFGGWLFGEVHNFTVRWIIVVLWVVVLVVYPVRRLVWWLTSYFVVTSTRVVHREGFVAKRSMEIPLDKINDVRFEQGIIDRMVGAGTLIIQSASESGREEFEFVRQPEEVQKTIYHQSELEQDRLAQGRPRAVAAAPPANVPIAPLGSPPAEPSGRPPAAPNVTTELERLADLRARGVLTEEEFQAQKARILRQP